ncbi:MAG: alpha/beta fold hydrolase [Bacteroidetes bacterium]|nr:alpha/beta fold hydrolase [Bacteroidota bacterium]
MKIKGRNIKQKINNINVSFNDLGRKEAPSIIFIHGFPFNKSIWDAQAEALKDNYRVITYDIRGHGESSVGMEIFTIELFVKDLIALMDILKIKKTIICGLSMGGYIALNAIENYPERFEALILSDTQSIADTPEVKEKRMNAVDAIRKHGVEKFANESIKNLFSSESFKTKTAEIAAVKAMILSTAEQVLYFTLLALTNRKGTSGNLPNIKVPVLIMVGEEDKITPPAQARYMHEKTNDSVLATISQSAHIPNLENTPAFNEPLIEFLNSISKMALKTP